MTNPTGDPCINEWCGGTARTKGLCANCYMAMRRAEKRARNPYNTRPDCLTPGCRAISQVKGRCKACHRRWEAEHPDPMLVAIRKIEPGGQACRELPEGWFSDSKDVTKVAIRLCHSCPLQLACRKLGEYEEAGVWGGVTRRTGRKPTDRLCERCGERKHHAKGLCAPCYQIDYRASAS